MIRTLQTAETSGITWIDVTAPTAEELGAVAVRYGLHATLVEDSLDPAHLPKFERIGDAVFIILRVWDARPERDGVAVQDVTRKIAVFLSQDLVITIHRAELPAIAVLEREHRRSHAAGERCSPTCFLVALMHEVLASYDEPLASIEQTLGEFEAAIFSPRVPTPDLLSLHQLKGRVSVVRRLMWLTIGVIQRFMAGTDRSGPLYQDLRETVEGYHFQAEHLLEASQNLIAMQLAVASHRTNEVMRILTVFSAFFLPLTFVVGIYGMNFAHMPELAWRIGYPLVLALMAAISTTIFVWFRRRGWLGRPVD